MTIQYEEYPGFAHTQAAVRFEPRAVQFLVQRFAGLPATDDCASVGTGNSLAPVAYVPPKPVAAGPSGTTSPRTTGSGSSLASTGGAPLLGLAGLLLVCVAGAYRRVTS
jgi:hypothetical protein